MFLPKKTDVRRSVLNQETSRKKNSSVESSAEKTVMAVAISRDLTVQVLEDVNTVKLSERQQALRAAIHKGEPKSLGVTQVMLGLMVISYSIPLHFTEVTEVVLLGVPWWSGLMFIIAGLTAIILDKHSTMKVLSVCFLVSGVSTLLSLVAVSIYSVDMDRNPEVPCIKSHHDCDSRYYAVMMSRGVKSSLLVFTLAQMAVSSIVCFLLYKQRRSFGQYTSMSHDAPSTPTSFIPPDLN